MCNALQRDVNVFPEGLVPPFQREGYPFAGGCSPLSAGCVTPCQGDVLRLSACGVECAVGVVRVGVHGVRWCGVWCAESGVWWGLVCDVLYNMMVFNDSINDFQIQ